MKLAHLRSIAIRTLLCGFCIAGAQSWACAQDKAASRQENQASARAQSSSTPKPRADTISKSQKVANPLNDLLEEAQRDIDKNNFADAIAPLQKVIAEHPEFAYAHFQLAYVYTALKRTDEARAEYTRTIAIDPKMSEAYLNLGMVLLDQQEDAAAVAPLRKAVELLPSQSRPDTFWGSRWTAREIGLALGNPSKPCYIWIPTTSTPSITWVGRLFRRVRLNKPKPDSGARWKFSRMRLGGARVLRKAWTPRKSPRPPAPTMSISNSSPMIPKRGLGSSIFSSNRNRTTRPSRN